jgi:hypothetical protein
MFGVHDLRAASHKMNPAKKYLEAAAEPEKKESVYCLPFPCCFLLLGPSHGLYMVLLLSC